MGFLYGFIGAILGAVLGWATAWFLISTTSQGDIFGDALAFATFGLTCSVIGAALGIGAALLALRHAKKTQKNGTSQRKPFLAVGVFLAVPATVAVLLWSASLNEQKYSRTPSDQKLLDNFSRHRDTFNQLVKMKQDDRVLYRLANNWTVENEATPSNNPIVGGFKSNRLAKYQRLMNEAKVPGGLSSSEDGTEVDFTYWYWGSGISSSTNKGYAYLTVPPKETLPSLDGCQPDEKNGVEAYRHIEGPWYLYYEYLPG